MPSLVRSWIALSAVVAPALALAQPADPAASTSAGFGWLWILAAVAIVAALFCDRVRPPPWFASDAALAASLSS